MGESGKHLTFTTLLLCSLLLISAASAGAVTLPGAKWWSYTASDQFGYSSPAIADDGTIYIGNNNHNLIAINPDGTQKWVYTTGDRISSTPAIASDGTVYVGSEDGKVYAINPDGSKKWDYDTGALYLSSSPAIGLDGTVYIGAANGKFYALDTAGNKKWEYQASTTGIFSSAAVGLDETVYFGDRDGKLIALDKNGNLKWKAYMGGNVDSSPAVGADGTIYVGCNDNNLYAINNSDGSTKWTFSDPANTVFSSPAIGLDGTVYVGSHDGKLYAVKPDGSKKWEYNVGNLIYTSPAVGADGTVFFGSHTGTFFAVNPNGTTKWSYSTGGLIFTSPAIDASGRIYFGSIDKELYCIHDDCGGPAASTWPMFGQSAKRQSSYIVSIVPPAIFEPTGWWYTPGEEGSGLSLGINGSLIFMAWYSYDNAGDPVWFVSWLSNTSGPDYEGKLRIYTGSELGSPWMPVTYQEVGTVTLSFQDSDNADLSWTMSATNGMKSIKKYMPDLIPAGSEDPRGITGWYYDAAYPGMGWFLQAYGDTLYLGWYHFTTGGKPYWRVMGGWTDIGGFPSTAGTYAANLMTFSAGQTIGGTYTPPIEIPTLGGAYTTLNFLPGGDIQLDWAGLQTYTLTPYTITSP